jgi:hypothetical protein
MHRGWKTACRTLALAAVTLGAATASAQALTPGDLTAYPPHTLPYGQSYSQYAADWWQWVLAQPASTNPATDTTGGNCAVGQSNPFVWFLAGDFGGTVTRSCTVPFGKALLIPVVNTVYGAFLTDPADQRTVQYVRSQVTPVAQAATGLKASFDSLALDDVSSYFEQSSIFSSTLPAGNIFGAPAGTVLSPSADAGYYLVFYPPLPGVHTIEVAGTIGGSPVDVTYHLNVKVG